MDINDFSTYTKFFLDGVEYIVLVELPVQKALCCRVGDVEGGATTVPVVLMEAPVRSHRSFRSTPVSITKIWLSQPLGSYRVVVGRSSG